MTWKRNGVDVLAMDPLTRDDLEWFNYEANRHLIESLMRGQQIYYYGYEYDHHEFDNKVHIPKGAGKAANSIDTRDDRIARKQSDEYERTIMTNRLIALFAKTFRVSYEVAESQIKKALI